MLQCYVDNKLIGTTSASSLSCNWNTRKVLQRVHNISARTDDTSSNTATATLQVNVGASTKSRSSKGNKGRRH